MRPPSEHLLDRPGGEPSIPAALRREIADCCRTGTATVWGELTADADSAATRVVNAEGQVAAGAVGSTRRARSPRALSVVVRAESVKHQAVLPSVIASGLGISRLGWRPGVKVAG